jgi:glutathionylspermidine synthase
VEKPLLGREGQNVTIRDASGQFSRVGDYADSGQLLFLLLLFVLLLLRSGHILAGFVYQKTCMPTCIDGNYVVFGGWVVGDTASALGIRYFTTLSLFHTHTRVVPAARVDNRCDCGCS